MESQGASSPGILILTTSLSKPFMRLEKYVTLLQELERHMEVRRQCVDLCSRGSSQSPFRLTLLRNSGKALVSHFT